jgi:hypothetical protein
MSELVALARSRSLLDDAPILRLPSFGAGVDSKLINDHLTSMRKLLSGPVAGLAEVKDLKRKGDLADQILEKRASLKRITATIAMHLDRGWRESLFAELDRLLDPEDWDESFKLPTEQSFSTFLRMIIYLHPTKRPALGLSATGHLLAAWSRGKDRITIECVGQDEVRWVLSRTVDGDRESGAGRTQLHRVPEVTAPYEPEHLFQDGDKILA